MSKSIDEIKAEVLDFLDIRNVDVLPNIELFKLLDKKRKKVHPDKTTDDDVKKEFEEKIKLANDLYEKFGKHIKEEQEDTSVAIQKYNNDQNIIAVDFINTKFENDALKADIEDLRNKVKSLKSEISQKEQIILSLNDKKSKEETEKLKHYFKPKTSNMIALGAAALFGILISVLLKVEETIGIFTKYIPESFINIANIVTFFLLFIIVCIFTISYIKKRIINDWVENVNSTEFYYSLFDYVCEHENEPTWNSTYSYRTKTFKERVIYDFIKKRFEPKSKFKKLIQKIIGLNYYSVFENLKKIIICQLISKGVLKTTGKSGFDINFSYD